MLGRLDRHLQKNVVGPLLYTIRKTYLNWIIDLNIKAKTMEFSEGNISLG